MSFNSESASVVHVWKAADNGAGVTGDSINMGKVSKVVYVISHGSITGDAVLTAKSGATAGTETTSETFRYRLADGDQAAASADLYGDWTSVSTLTLTAATYDNKTLIVEVDDDTLTAAQPWLTLSVSSAASNIFSACIAICSPRYQAHDSVTVLT